MTEWGLCVVAFFVGAKCLECKIALLTSSDDLKITVLFRNSIDHFGSWFWFVFSGFVTWTGSKPWNMFTQIRRQKQIICMIGDSSDCRYKVTNHICPVLFTLHSFKCFIYSMWLKMNIHPHMSSLPVKPYLGNEAYFPAIKGVVERLPLHLHWRLCDGFEE